MTVLPGLCLHWLPLRIGQSKPCGDEDPEVWWDGEGGTKGSHSSSRQHLQGEEHPRVRLPRAGHVTDLISLN